VHFGFLGINRHNESDFIAITTYCRSAPNLFHRIVSLGWLLPHRSIDKSDRQMLAGTHDHCCHRLDCIVFTQG
jgi:hypothetical protein